MSEFTFNKKNRIILYGAASIGAIVLNNLKKQGFSIAGFIDKRANEIEEFEGYPVYSMNDNRLTYQYRKQVNVVVSVKNVFEHETIVAELLNHGYENLIYKSRIILNNRNINNLGKRLLSDLYDGLLCGEFEQVLTLEKTDSVQLNDFSDYALVQSDGDIVLAHIPLEFIYTNDYNTEESKWGNLNIMGLFTHLGLFRKVLGNSKQTHENYVEEFCVHSAPKTVKITERWKENVIRNRTMIFEQMNIMSEIDSNFFIRNAAEAKWNQRGYFNLTSGKHRASFFATKNYKYMPLKISHEDYNLFLNMEYASSLSTLLSDTPMLSSPIAHPYFYRFSCLSNEYYYNLISYYTDYIVQKKYTECNLEFHKISIADFNNEWGVAGHFSRMGFDTYRIGELTEDYLLRKKLLHTTRIKDIDVKELELLDIDFLFYENNNVNEIQLMLDQYCVSNLVLTCNKKNPPELEGYQIIDCGFTAYHNDRFVYTRCYGKVGE